MIDFPNSPTIGQTFTDAGTTWVWDGAKWVAQVPPAQAIIAGAPPTGIQGDLWWDDAGGQLYVYYNDGTSAQWVQATNLPNSAIAVPVSIAQGGTAGTTAPAALANLGGAPLASPVFTGNPQGPTPAPADSSVSLATTAFVKAQGYTTGGPYLPLTGGTLTGQLVPAHPAGIAGTPTNDNAPAGAVGELIAATFAASSIGSNTAFGLGAIPLTAGDWDVWGDALFTMSGNIANSVVACINTTNTIGGAEFLMALAANSIGGMQVAIPFQRASLSASSNLFLVVQSGFSGGTVTASGHIYARRAR